MEEAFNHTRKAEQETWAGEWFIIERSFYNKIVQVMKEIRIEDNKVCRELSKFPKAGIMKKDSKKKLE